MYPKKGRNLVKRRKKPNLINPTEKVEGKPRKENNKTPSAKKPPMQYEN
jgi:hypothetical protein